MPLVGDILFPLLQFCRDVPPGHMRAIDCLETNRYEPDFSAGCREALEVSIAERAGDFRLDASLRAACSKDIERRYWCMRSSNILGGAGLCSTARQA